MIASIPPYKPSRLLRSAHVQTVSSSLFRRVDGVEYERERIETPDDDFLDLDWIQTPTPDSGPRRVVVVSHGFEGDSDRSYVRGMARAFTRRGWDVCAWNFRGCSGEPNRRFYSYHSGKTEDLEFVIRHILSGDSYDVVGLVGFSLGGNMMLKYLGERGSEVDDRIAYGVAFSVPCDLSSSSEKMARPENYVYMKRFFRSLAEKARLKADMYPGRIDPDVIAKMRTFKEFDEYYTAPAHGFSSAADYWKRASSKPFLQDIQTPALLVNAHDDPFLSAECFPQEDAESNPNFHLIAPQYGGHVGFMALNRVGEYWSETVAARFAEQVLRGESGARQAA